MQTTIENIGNVAIVELPYEKIDISCKQEFQDDVAEALAEPSANVIFDMTRVQFVDSAGIGAIVCCLRQLTGSGGDLKLCNVSKPVRGLFELVRLHRLIEIFNTREEALRAFEAD